MMVCRSRCADRPAHHPASDVARRDADTSGRVWPGAKLALLVATVSTLAGPVSAGALDVLGWMKGVELCLDAMSRGVMLDTRALKPALGSNSEVGPDEWPELQIWSSGAGASIFQERRPTGATADIRTCLVASQSSVTSHDVAVISANMVELVSKLKESGVFEDRATRRRIDGGSVLFLQTVDRNPRNCVLRFEFMADPARPFANLELKEAPSQACGAGETQESSK